MRSPTVGEQVCVRYENEPEALFRVVPASTPSPLPPPQSLPRLLTLPRSPQELCATNRLAVIFAGVKAAYPQTSWSFLD